MERAKREKEEEIIRGKREAREAQNELLKSRMKNIEEESAVLKDELRLKQEADMLEAAKNPPVPKKKKSIFSWGASSEVKEKKAEP